MFFTTNNQWFSAGPGHMTLNMHNVLHWPSIIYRWGPAWNYSNYNPESLNGWIRRRCYGTGWMITKASTRFIQAKSIVREVQDEPDSDIRRFCSACSSLTYRKCGTELLMLFGLFTSYLT